MYFQSDLSTIFVLCSHIKKYLFMTLKLIVILAINQLNAQNLFFIISSLYASTCFKHYELIIRGSKLYYTASGIITPVIHFTNIQNLKKEKFRRSECIPLAGLNCQFKYSFQKISGQIFAFL